MNKSTICIGIAFILLISAVCVLIYDPFRTEYPTITSETRWGCTFEPPEEPLISSSLLSTILLVGGVISSLVGIHYTSNEMESEFKEEISKILSQEDAEKIMEIYRKY